VPEPRERTEDLVLSALQQHAFSSARRFRDPDAEGISRAALAAAAGVSRPTVQTVEKSEARRLLAPSPHDGAPIRFNSDAAFALAAEYGSRHARVAIADLNGQLFERRDGFETAFPFNTPPKPYLDWTAEKIDELLAAAEVAPEQVMGLAISRAAPIDASTGLAHAQGLPNKEWRGINVAEHLARRREWLAGVPSITDSDATLSALAERTFGAARDWRDFVYVKWSDTISTGLVLSGFPYRGSTGYGGQIGHLVTPGAGATEQCRFCGREGCLQMRIGVSNLAAALGVTEVDDATRLADDLLARIDLEDPNRAGLRAAAALLGETVAPLVDALNPEGLLLGGWMGSAIHDHSDLLNAFRDALEGAAIFADGIPINPPRLHRSAVHGATLRVLIDETSRWAHRA
jgi:predicted NBD/HSP70 family sugar kinase